jgi:hypothetical protein
MKEANLITSGGRGRYAPHMRPLDAVRVLIALMATDRPSEAVTAVDRWRAMSLRPNESEGILPAELSGGPTLEQALVRLLAVDPNPAKWPAKWPAFQLSRNEKTAFLEWGLGQPPRAVFRDALRDDDRKELFGIRRMCLVAPIVLGKIASGMWVDRFQGCDTEGHPLNLGHQWNQMGTADERRARTAAIYEFVRKRDSDWRLGCD